MTTRRDVAVLGLGAMGLPMTRRLVSTGLRVSAFDIDSGRAKLSTAEAARSPAEAAQDNAVVLVAVRTYEQVSNALFGPEGAVGSLGGGAVIILTSTVGVDAARMLADRLAPRGVDLLDAPVSGGPIRAASGELVVFVGGTAVAQEAARPILQKLASNINIVGERVGDGQAMKMVNQLLAGTHVAAAAEALALADALGLDPQRVVDVLSNGAAASFMLEHRGPRIAQTLAGHEPEVQSRIDIFVKDMGLVIDSVRSAGTAAPVASTAEQLFRLAAVAGQNAHDDSTVVRLLRNSPSSCLPGKARAE
jgi:3-hydroxyisobutyrate dehydrogenase